MLLCAPLAGHRAVLLRDTVMALLGHADVYITDWIDARDVPPGAIGGERVPLDGRPWLKAALNVLGNGMYGLQALHREEVLAGLLALKRTPRMVSGRPRARRKT